MVIPFSLFTYKLKNATDFKSNTPIINNGIILFLYRKKTLITLKPPDLFEYLPKTPQIYFHHLFHQNPAIMRTSKHIPFAGIACIIILFFLTAVQKKTLRPLQNQQ